MKSKTNIGVSSCILYHKSKSNTLTGDSVQHWQWQSQQRDQGIFVLHDQTTTACVPGAAAMASCNTFSVKEQYFVHGSSAYVHTDRTERNKTVSIHLCLPKLQTHGVVVEHMDYTAVYRTEMVTNSGTWKAVLQTSKTQLFEIRFCTHLFLKCFQMNNVEITDLSPRYIYILIVAAGLCPKKQMLWSYLMDQ